jgi:hypothetical protein
MSHGTTQHSVLYYYFAELCQIKTWAQAQLYSRQSDNSKWAALFLLHHRIEMMLAAFR